MGTDLVECKVPVMHLCPICRSLVPAMHFACVMASEGGAVRGASKRRGDSTYYVKLANTRWAGHVKQERKRKKGGQP